MLSSGAPKPTSLCAQRVPGGPPKSVTHSSQSPPLKSTTGKLPVSLTAAPQQLQIRQDPHARDTQTAKDSTCLRASLTDRQATGRERSGAAQELRAGTGFQTQDFSPAHCLPTGTNHHQDNSTETHANGCFDQHKQLPSLSDMVRRGKSNF